MQKKILIAGYYGFGNLGDEAILTMILDGLRRLSTVLDITIVSGSPEETERLYSVTAISWSDLDTIIQKIEDVDLVFLGGGGLFQDTWDLDWSSFLTSRQVGIPYYASFPILAKAAGKPCIIFSTGVGPLKTKESKSLTQIAFENADIATVRDQQSLDCLASLGVVNPSIHLSADPAFALVADQQAADHILRENLIGIEKDTPILGISVRNWDLNRLSDDWQREFAHALDQFLGVTGAFGMFIPFQAVGQPMTNDSIAAQSIIEKMELAEQVKIVYQQNGVPYTPEVVAGFFARCDLTIGMRLHSVILSASVGTPIVGISYDPKVRNHMQRLGQSEYVLELDTFDSPALLKVLTNAWASKHQIRFTIKQIIGHLKKDAERDFEFVSLLLEDKYNPKPFSDPDYLSKLVIKQTKALVHTEQALIKLQTEKGRIESSLQSALQSAQAQATEWQRQLDEIHASTSWKFVSVLGRARLMFAPTGSLRERFFKRIVQFVIDNREHNLRYAMRALVKRSSLRDNDWQATLDSLLVQHSGNVKEIIVFMPSVEWNLPLFQRPQQMALAFARLGCLVLYFEPQYAKATSGIHQIEERLYRCHVPLDALDKIENLVAVVFTYNKDFLSKLCSPRIVYEYIDDLDVFPYDQVKLKRNHTELCRSATVVVTTAERLYNEVQQIRPDAILCPNGVDYNHFLTAREPVSSPPSDLTPILERNEPVIGYYGALARWFDYELLATVAKRRPHLSFLLIGPDYDGTLPQSRLLDIPNIHWLGIRPYNELPRYLACFDIATIPFKTNDITHATSPLKLYEYMAGHKPVIVTAMHESSRIEGVLTAHTAEEFVDQIDRALELRKNAEYIAKIDQVARENTWDTRAEQILQVLSEQANKTR